MVGSSNHHNPETPTFTVKTLGDGDDGPGTRRMFDKRTLRKMYRDPFAVAIGEFRDDQAAGNVKAKAPLLPAGGTAVYVRKRPMFANETEMDEFDIISALDNGEATALGFLGLQTCWLRRTARRGSWGRRTVPAAVRSQKARPLVAHGRSALTRTHVQAAPCCMTASCAPTSSRRTSCTARSRCAVSRRRWATMRCALASTCSA